MCTVLFFKILFSVSFEELSLQRCKFKILFETVKAFGCIKHLYFTVAYFLLCKLSYGYHNQANFYQCLPNGMLFSCEFAMGYEKNTNFLVITKSPKV